MLGALKWINCPIFACSFCFGCISLRSHINEGDYVVCFFVLITLIHMQLSTVSAVSWQNYGIHCLLSRNVRNSNNNDEFSNRRSCSYIFKLKQKTTSENKNKNVISPSKARRHARRRISVHAFLYLFVINFRFIWLSSFQGRMQCVYRCCRTRIVLVVTTAIDSDCWPSGIRL